MKDSQISITFGKEQFASLQEKAGLSKSQVRCFAGWLANLLGVRGDERVASVLGLPGGKKFWGLVLQIRQVLFAAGELWISGKVSHGKLFG